jgi:hypothetical protein
MTNYGRSILLFSGLAALGCSDNEAPAEDHTPTSYTIQVNDVPVNAPYTFTSSETVRVRIKFFNEADEDLDDVESTHFGGLSFEPASLATVVRVSDHNYQFDVTGGTPGAGTLRVSYGHDDAADEHTFPTAPVMVLSEGGAASRR